jgi:hypothetical protein
MLYRATFAWNAVLGRGRYLAAFPVLAAMSSLQAMFMPNPARLEFYDSARPRDSARPVNIKRPTAR